MFKVNNNNKKENVHKEIIKWTNNRDTKSILLGTAMIDKQKYQSEVIPWKKENNAIKRKIQECHRPLNEHNFDHIRKFETFVKKYKI